LLALALVAMPLHAEIVRLSCEGAEAGDAMLVEVNYGNKLVIWANAVDMKWLGPVQAKITDERVAAYYRPLQTRGGQLAALRARTQADQFPVEPDLGKISVRTLIIWGAEDELIPLAAGRKMNSLIKDSKLLVIEKCGHLPQEETPERVVEEITRFIKGR